MKRPAQRIRFWRDHRWTPGKLSAYLDGELVERSRRRVRRHIHDCPECRSALRGLERMLRLLHSTPHARNSQTPDIAAAVRRRLRDPTT
jgi:anti-sigma factor RsiW